MENNRECSFNKQKRKVEDDWKPTLQNVTREFITESLYQIMFSEVLPNFQFYFSEKEARMFIEKTLDDYVNETGFNKKEATQIKAVLNDKDSKKSQKKIMVVNDYKQFFENLRRLYERHIELFFQRCEESTYFPRYEKDNFFEQIWLRATPEDFNHPEDFLNKQVQMVNDKTFEKYDTETYIGRLDFLNNYILCVKNGIARVWDENTREMQFTIYDDDYFDDRKKHSRQSYTLPLIRYGIYEKDGKKICFIGSIQNIKDSNETNELEKRFDRTKYKVNEGVSKENQDKVEPKNLIALSMFINMINREGITEFEIPSSYVLDYDYHLKRNDYLLSDFERKWNKYKIKRYPERYEKEKYLFELEFNKQDLINEIKTKRFSRTFRRLLLHYKKAKILGFSGKENSFMHLVIPEIKSEDDISGTFLKRIYRFQKENRNKERIIKRTSDEEEPTLD